MTKMRRYVSLFAILQLAAACSQQPATQSRQETLAERPVQVEQASGDERLILAFGDSLYAGYGLDQGQSFPAVLERELEAGGIVAEVVNAGVSGDTTAAGLGRLQFTLDGLARKPDLVILGLGANDALRGIDPAETRHNLEAIMTELERRDIDVLLTGMMAPRNLGNDYASRFDPIFPDLAKRFDASLDPFFMDGVITRKDLLLNDGLHPNAQGVEVMARRVAPMVARDLEEDEAA